MEGHLGGFHQDLDKIFSQGPLRDLGQDLDIRWHKDPHQNAARWSKEDLQKILVHVHVFQDLTPEP